MPWRENPDSEKRIHELLAVEWCKIGFLFSCADEAGGDTEFMLDSDGDASFAAAVELGENHAGEANGFVELAGLDESV